MMTKKPSSQNFSSEDMKVAIEDSLEFYLERRKINKEMHDNILSSLTKGREKFLFEKFFSDTNQFIVEFINTTMRDWVSDVIETEISSVYPHTQMNEVEQLKHRLAMVSDDLNVIKSFISRNGLEETFKKETECADECWSHISNIEIACDLEKSESLGWKRFNTDTGL